MNRTESIVLLLLAGIAWACVFAVVGYAVFARVPDNNVLAAVFAGFGFVAGLACAALRLAFDYPLPVVPPAGSRDRAASAAAADAVVWDGSVFGA